MLYRIVVLSCFTLFLGLMSCEDPVVNPNDELVNNEDSTLRTTDTVTLTTKTLRENPLSAKNLENAILGSMDDDDFGKSSASFYTHVTLPSNNVSFDDNLTFDSLVLTLDYSGSYGNIEKGQDIEIYQMIEKIRDDKNYESDATFNTNQQQVLKRVSNFTPDLQDSVTIDGETKPGHMRIKLNQTNFIGQNFIRRVEQGFSSKADFNSYLEGFFVTVDTTSGFGEGVTYFNLASPQSKLTLYYKDGNNNNQTFNFVINDSTNWVNHYTHNYSNTLAGRIIDNESPDSLMMVQAMSGLQGKINFPYLNELGDILVNEAELVISVTEENKTYPAPKQMNALRIDTTLQNTFVFIGDQFTATNSLGAKVKRYKFTIEDYLQSVINGQIDNDGIVLRPFPNNAIADRAIIGGGNHSVNNVQMNLTYTKIE